MITPFQREFWQQKLLDDAREPDRVAIIDGTHYYIDDEDSEETYFRGFAGAHFTIRFHDGRVIETTNLWCQGDIPDEFRDLFPNNADFDWQWKRIGNYKCLVKK